MGGVGWLRFSGEALEGRPRLGTCSPMLIGTSHKGFVKPKRNIIFQNMFSSEFDILIKLMKLTLTQHTDCVTTPCVFV